MRYTTLLSTLSLIAGLVSPTTAQTAQQPVSVECSESSTFEGFLNALLAVLHYSGNTAFEEVVAEWSETEAGYEVLQGVQSAVLGQEKWTMLVPTDSVSPYHQCLSTPLITRMTGTHRCRPYLILHQRRGPLLRPNVPHPPRLGPFVRRIHLVPLYRGIPRARHRVFGDWCRSRLGKGQDGGSDLGCCP